MMVKQSELLRRIARAAHATGVTFAFVRHGGKHDVYRFGGRLLAIPRHREITERTAREILRKLDIR